MRQAIVFAVALVVACKSPATKAEKARGELASWAAAGAMLSGAWSQETAQTPYVKSTVEVASEEVNKLRDTLQGDRSVDEVAKLYEKLSQAVSQEDRQSAAKLAGPFNAISRRIKPQS